MRIVCHAWRDLSHENAGGSEQYVDILGRNLIRLGHNFTLVAGGPVGERDYPVFDSGGTFSQYLRTPFIDNHAGKFDLTIDIANGMAHCSPLWSRRPTILVWHHLHGEQWKQFFSRPIARCGKYFERVMLPLIYRKSLIVVVSESSRTELLEIGFDPRKIFLVPNSVHQIVADVERSEMPTYVALGRLVPQKRVNLLLDIWEEIRTEIGGELQIIGDGPLRAEFEHRNVPGVRFHGFVSGEEKRRLLAKAWLLLHPSEREGWGIAITEAGVQGTPCVAFNVAGVRDAVKHNETGLLALSKDEFARHWIEMRFNSTLRNDLGEGARQYASTFSEERSLNDLEKVLQVAVS